MIKNKSRDEKLKVQDNQHHTTYISGDIQIPISSLLGYECKTICITLPYLVTFLINILV